MDFVLRYEYQQVVFLPQDNGYPLAQIMVLDRLNGKRVIFSSEDWERHYMDHILQEDAGDA